MKDDIGGVWRTIGGRRVFIKDGQDIATAMKESGKFPSANKKDFNESWIERKLNAERAKDEEVDNIAKTIELEKEEYFACNNVLKKYKENNSENLYLIDKNTLESKSEIVTSNSNSSVSFSKKQELILNKSEDRSLIAIHNHPGNGTFSLQDVESMIENKKLGGIMVVTEDYIYSLKSENINISINTLEDKLSIANDNMLEKYPYLSNNHLYHLAYKEVFDEMGWEYGRTKRKKD